MCRKEVEVAVCIIAPRPQGGEQASCRCGGKHGLCTASNAAAPMVVILVLALRYFVAGVAGYSRMCLCTRCRRQLRPSGNEGRYSASAHSQISAMCCTLCSRSLVPCTACVPVRSARQHQHRQTPPGARCAAGDTTTQQVHVCYSVS